MLARVDADGAVLRAEAKPDAPVVARIDRGTLVRLEAARSEADGVWIRAALPEGKSGFLPASVGLHVFREVALKQAEVEVFDRPGTLGMPVRTLKKGAPFQVLRTVEEPGGDWVEIHEPSGARGFVPAKTRIAAAGAATGGGAFEPEARAIRRGVLGGVVMMAVAVAWFVLGYRAGRIFYYPPVLFLIGLYAVVRGVFQGNVAGRGDAAGDSAWPAPSAAWSRKRLGAVAVGGVLLAALVAMFFTRRGDAKPASLWLVSALDVPVIATVDGAATRLEPRTSRRIDARAGRRHVVVRTEAGATVEELDVDDPASGAFALYNVLGAATVVVDQVEYTAAPHRDAGRAREPEILVGTPWTVARRVDYPFEAAPERLRTSGAREVRRRATLVDGGWLASVEHLSSRGENARAGEVAAQVALAQGDERSLCLAGNVVVGADPAEGLRFAEEAVARHPASVQAHRVLQEALKRLGRRADAVARYRAAYEREPDSARAQYLYARALPAAEAAPLLERAVAAHPDDSWLRLALAWNLYEARRYEASIPHYERVREEDVGAESSPFAFHACALVAAGRTRDAQRLVRDRLRSGDWEALILYGKLRRLPDADRTLPAALDLVASVAPAGSDLGPVRGLVAGRCRDAVAFAEHAEAIGDPDFREASRIGVLTATDLDQAVEASVRASAATRRNLDLVAAVVVACELARRGREDLAREIHESHFDPRFPALSVADLASPATASAKEDLDLEVRAALLLSAARGATDPSERDRLLAQARALDLLRCVVPP